MVTPRIIRPGNWIHLTCAMCSRTEELSQCSECGEAVCVNHQGLHEWNCWGIVLEKGEA